MQPSHDELLRSVCQQVKSGKGKLLTVYKPNVSHTPRTIDYKKECYPVDLSKLTRILHINAKEGWAHVEGLVTMDQLVTVSLEYGLIPAVCPEIRAFTVAGLINGRGIQSSSHKYSTFEMKDNITEIEVVLGDGSVVVCDEQNHSDFYFRIKGCYGTLGFITAAKVRLVPATKVVKSEYHVFDQVSSFCSFMESQLERPHFLDGVVFARDHAVAIVSDFVEKVPNGDDDKVFHPLYPERPGEMFYYQYVKATTSKGKKTYTDYIPTKEFIHRSERGLWWMTEANLNDDKLCSVRPFRAFLERETAKQYKMYGFNDRLLTRNERRRTMVAQDQGFRKERVCERIHYSIEHMGIFPIWVCYIRRHEGHEGKYEGNHIADIGLYGFPPKRSYRCQRDLRAWQLSADSKAAWGELYLTADEMGKANGEFGPDTRALREKYKAAGSFKRIEDKITFYDVNEPDLGGPVPFWRIRRVWRYSKTIFFALAFTVPFIKLWLLVAPLVNVVIGLIKLPFAIVQLPYQYLSSKSDSKAKA